MIKKIMLIMAITCMFCQEVVKADIIDRIVISASALSIGCGFLLMASCLEETDICDQYKQENNKPLLISQVKEHEELKAKIRKSKEEGLLPFTTSNHVRAGLITVGCGAIFTTIAQVAQPN